MLQTDFLQFLYELSQNNNRDWFEANKKRYESTVKKPFEALVATLIRELQAMDPIYEGLLPKQCVFRIYRDTRFSADKTPYKTHVSAAFAPGAKGSTEQMAFPGYYFQIGYGSLMLGGGAYMLEKEMLHKVRTAILRDPSGYDAVAHDPAFLAQFPAGLMGERNKILPPDFKVAAQTQPALYQKQFYFMQELDPELALNDDFVSLLMNHFKAAKNTVDFLKKVMFQ